MATTSRRGALSPPEFWAQSLPRREREGGSPSRPTPRSRKAGEAHGARQPSLGKGHRRVCRVSRDPWARPDLRQPGCRGPLPACPWTLGSIQAKAAGQKWPGDHSTWLSACTLAQGTCTNRAWLGALSSPEPLDPSCMWDPKPHDRSRWGGIPTWDRAEPREAAGPQPRPRPTWLPPSPAVTQALNTFLTGSFGNPGAQSEREGDTVPDRSHPLRPLQASGETLGGSAASQPCGGRGCRGTRTGRAAVC